VSRGQCSFVQKAMHAEQAGALVMLVVNDSNESFIMTVPRHCSHPLFACPLPNSFLSERSIPTTEHEGARIRHTNVSHTHCRTTELGARLLSMPFSSPQLMALYAPEP